MTPPLAEISDVSGWFVLIAVVVAILAVIGVGIGLHFLRGLRTDFAKEIRSEMRTQTDATRVDLQQPLVVTPHEIPATHEQLATVKTELHGRIKREREEINAAITRDRQEINAAITRERDDINTEIKRVEAVASERAKELATDLKENTKLTAKMSGELGQMNQNIHTLTNSLTQFMQRQSNPRRNES
jgi:DNA anti-recombination protein RmuC